MIPKILHRIWVGPHKRPTEWMDTWKEKHPDWEFKTWDNDSVKGFIKQKEIDDCINKGLYHGAADIIRYEVLYKYGGVIAPADSICLHPIDELLEIEEDAFCCYQHEIKRPGLLSPHLGTTKGNKLMAELIDRIPKDIGTPWIQTGNKLLTDVVEELNYPIKIYPSHYFIPIYNDGSKQEGKAYAEHLWGTTRNIYPR